jgi:hypothetical protein
MKNLKKYILIAVIVVLFNSCAKDGPTGPQGAPGNANVNTYTFSTDSNSWQGFPQSGWIYQYKNLSMNLGGGVEVYWGGYLTNWYILPFAGNNAAINVQIHQDSSSVWIYFTPFPLDSPSIPVYNPGVQQFKIITIPKQ